MKNKNLVMEFVSYFKLTRNYWVLPVIFLILLCLPLVSAIEIGGYTFPDYTCSDGFCVAEDNRFYMNVTENSKGNIDLWIMTKTYTGNINLGFLYNRNDITPTSVKYYNPHEILQPWYDLFTNDYLGDFLTPITFSSLNKQIKTTIFNFDNKNTLKYIDNFPVTANVMNHLSIHFDIGDDVDNAKYDIVAWLSSYNLNFNQALNNNHLFLIDPYISGSNIQDSFNRSNRALNADTADNGKTYTCAGATAPSISSNEATFIDTGANPECQLEYEFEINASNVDNTNVTMKMKSSSTGYLSVMRADILNSSDVMQVSLYNDGNIKVYDGDGVGGGTWTTLQTYSAGTYYLIKFANINFTSHTFDVVVDGTVYDKAGSHYGFQYNFDHISRYDMIAAGTGTYYVDELIIEASVPTPPAAATNFTITAQGNEPLSTLYEFNATISGIGLNNTYNHTTSGLGDIYYYFNITGTAGTLYEYNLNNGTLSFDLPSICFTDPFVDGFITIRKNQPFLGGVNWSCKYSASSDYQLGAFGEPNNMTDLRIEFDNLIINSNTTTGLINTSILSNDTSLYNITIEAPYHFAKTYFDWNVSTNLIANLTQWPRVNLYNDWNGSEIINFSVVINSTTYTNETGNTVYVPYNTSISVQLNHPDYITRTLTHNFTNYNDLNTTLWQSEINIFAQKIILNTTINTWNLTIGSITYNATASNISLKPNTEFYNTWLAQSNGYYNLTPDINVTSQYQNFTLDFYTHLLNITINNSGGSPVTGTLYLVALNYTYNLTVNAPGYYEFGLLNGSYNITVDAANYAITSATVNVSLNDTYLRYNFELESTNSITFNFYDEETGLLIDYETITLELIGDNASYNSTTTDGTDFIDAIFPGLYAIRYSAPSYDERYYYFTLVNRTSNVLNLYLLNSSSSTVVTATVYDQNNNLLENAYIEVLRYDISTNSYFTVEIAKTNFEGETTLNLVLDDELYYFIIEYPYGTVEFISDPDPVTKSTITFQLILGDLAAEDFFNSQGIAYSLDFNNATNNFDYTFSDSTNTISQGCLYVYQVTGLSKTLVNSSCVLSTSGTINLGVANTTGTSYQASAYVYYGSNKYFLASAWAEFKESFDAGISGPFLIALLVFVFSIVGYYLGGMPTAVMLAPLPVFLGSILGLLAIAKGIAFTVVVMGIILGVFLGRE